MMCSVCLMSDDELIYCRLKLDQFLTTFWYAMTRSMQRKLLRILLQGIRRYIFHLLEISFWTVPIRRSFSNLLPFTHPLSPKCEKENLQGWKRKRKEQKEITIDCRVVNSMCSQFQAEKEAFEEAEKERKAREEKVRSRVDFIAQWRNTTWSLNFFNLI